MYQAKYQTACTCSLYMQGPDLYLSRGGGVCTHRGASEGNRWGLPRDAEAVAAGGEARRVGGGNGDWGRGLWMDSKGSSYAGL